MDASPGFVDRLALFEVALPSVSGTMTRISGAITRVGEMTGESAAELDRGTRQGKGFAFRLAVAKRLAVQLGEPVEQICTLASDFASQFHDVDDGIRAIIDHASVETAHDAEAHAVVCGFFGQVRALASAARGGVESARLMLIAMAPSEKMSRDLRPVLRRLRQGMTAMIEATEVSDEWVALIDQSSVVCEPQSAVATAQ